MKKLSDAKTMRSKRRTVSAHLSRHCVFVAPEYLVLFLVAVFSVGAGAQTFGTDGHTVTVTVQPISILQVNAGVVNLNISGTNAVAGQDQMTVTDQSSSLAWGTNSSLRKITVNSNLAVQLFTLKILAVNPTVGSAATEATLTTTGKDLVLNVGRSSGSCGLRYTAIALASQGTGTDSHTITFTVQAQ